MKITMRASLVMAMCAQFVPTLGLAQSVSDGPVIQIEVERQRIAQQRTLHEAAFSQAEQVCFSRFAVSDCLRQARTDRRVALSELRRQELLLNAMDRQGKAQAELKRISENVADKQTQQQKPENKAESTTP